MESTIRTVIADDHPIVLEGLTSLLQSEAVSVEVVGQADSWRKCISKLHELAPQLLITDLEMSGAQCVDALTRIKEQFPSLKIIALTMHFESQLVGKLLKLGIEGYVVKTFTLDEITAAVAAVAKGETYVAVSERDRFNRVIAKLTNFSAKQKDVLALLTLGFQAKEIAHHSGVPLSYVHTIVRDTKRKHNLTDKVQLIDFVRKMLPDDIETWRSKLRIS